MLEFYKCFPCDSFSCCLSTGFSLKLNQILGFFSITISTVWRNLLRLPGNLVISLCTYINLRRYITKHITKIFDPRKLQYVFTNSAIAFTIFCAFHYHCIVFTYISPFATKFHPNSLIPANWSLHHYLASDEKSSETKFPLHLHFLEAINI